MARVTLTEKELAAATFCIAMALEDEEPSNVKSAAQRALKKLRSAATVRGQSAITWEDGPQGSRDTLGP